jgi:hypothetical protein
MTPELIAEGLALTQRGPQAPTKNEGKESAAGWLNHLARGILTGWPRPSVAEHEDGAPGA